MTKDQKVYNRYFELPLLFVPLTLLITYNQAMFHGCEIKTFQIAITEFNLFLGTIT